ncbi:PEP-CTERM sorting domain-containing protein [Paludisphaera rhizosphaerae]|uniref:PEP-CTERM sorting domain-containing protein n=1 Tax=Paludisphaera rhizosphaerae TaxID=2711216 RepID=UPI0013ED8F2A|nr:PEP-CTERM sorting domain-containing protein [Paludisphaera rhizosphaerae]
MSLAAVGSTGTTEAGLIVTADAPSVQATLVAGATTENFDGFRTGLYSSLDTAVGRLSTNGAFAILAANVYGGAGGKGEFFSVGVQSGSTAPTTLTLNGPQAYFGFYWSSADWWNNVSFYSGGQLIATFNAAYVLDAISHFPNGGQYYVGVNPFIYLNFIGTDGTTFDSIVFTNTTASQSGFESDNWSVSATTPAVVTGTVIAGGVDAAVPEPSAMVLMGLGISGIAAVARTARKQRGTRPVV